MCYLSIYAKCVPVTDLAADTELIRDLVNHVGTNPASVAKKAGVAVTTINRPFNGSATTRLGRTVLEKLRKTFPDYPGWVEQSSPRESSEILGEDDDLVDVAVSDIAYGLGGSYVDDHAAQVTIERFPRSFIRQFSKGPIDRLYFAAGIGDSMEPTIHSSDLVLVDRSQDMLRVSDQVWAAAVGEISMVKRVRVLAGGDVLLVSDKPGVSDYLVAQGELQLIGRVVAVVKKL